MADRFTNTCSIVYSSGEDGNDTQSEGESDIRYGNWLQGQGKGLNYWLQTIGWSPL